MIEYTEIKVKLTYIADVIDFVKCAMSIPCDVDACQNHYIVDAKSLMGIFSLDISKVLIVRVVKDNEKYLEEFKKWRVD